MYDEGYSFEMDFYGDEYNIDFTMYPFCIEKGRFNHKNLCNVMSDIDILVIPSVGYETFGFTAVEGLSCGTVVLLSTRVGSKDVFKFVNTPHLFDPSIEGLTNILRQYLNTNDLILEALKQQQNVRFDFSIIQHSVRLLSLIEKIESHDHMQI